MSALVLVLCAFALGLCVGLWLGFKLWRESYVSIKPMSRERWR